MDLCFAIKRRRNYQYRILLALISNPHTEDPKQLWDVLNDDGPATYAENEKLDKSGFDQLKLAMADNPRIIIK